jgi:hypothetical protein
MTFAHGLLPSRAGVLWLPFPRFFLGAAICRLQCRCCSFLDRL